MADAVYVAYVSMVMDMQGGTTYRYVIVSTNTARPSWMHRRLASWIAEYTARTSFPSTRMVCTPYPGPRDAIPSP